MAAITIANPIYDAVFKALMDDPEIASDLLEALLGVSISRIEMSSHEQAHVSSEPGSITTYRLDFAAVIQFPDGASTKILIELQKAREAGHIARFRTYLSKEYVRPWINPRGEKEILPILPVYFLGFSIDQSLPAVFQIKREYWDVVKSRRIPRQGLGPEFIEKLSHDMYIVQIPGLAEERQTELEQLLMVFDQSQIDEENRHRLIVEAEAAMKENPKLRKIMERLASLSENKELDFLMSLEDQLQMEQEDAVREVRKSVEKERLEKEEERRLKEEERRQKEEERRQKETLIKALLNAGKSKAEIAAMLSVDETEIR